MNIKYTTANFWLNTKLILGEITLKYKGNWPIEKELLFHKCNHFLSKFAKELNDVMGSWNVYSY